MPTEIRDYGDKKTVAVYSDEKPVVSNLISSRKLLKDVGYFQTQRGVEKLVGVDLYFDKKHRSWLERKIGVGGG